MTLEGGYRRLEDSGVPPVLRADTAETSKGKGKISISCPTSEKAITVAAKKIKPLGKEKGKKKTSAFSQTVELKAEDSEHHFVKISVKIKELSRALGVSAREVKIARDNGRLEEFIVKSLIGESASLASPPQQITEAIRESISSNLAKLGMSKAEFEQIAHFYESNSADLQKAEYPQHIRKDSVDPPLPRSLVYVPKGPRKGLYVLLKTKGGVKEIGLGASNRATKMLHIDSGQMKVFRNGKAEAIEKHEFIANQKAQSRPDLLAAGIPVVYTGPWRTREREKNQPKDHIEQELDVEKVGFIMDWMEGGELFDKLQEGELSDQQAVFMGIEIAKGLQCMHRDLGLVHLDLKPENIFLTKEGAPRISDFGYTRETGKTSPFCGSPGFIAPELVAAEFYQAEYEAAPSADVWALGCILAELKHGAKWYNWNGQGEGKWTKVTNAANVEAVKKTLFPNKGDPMHLDSVIDACLKVEEDERITSEEAVRRLEEIYAAL